MQDTLLGTLFIVVVVVIAYIIQRRRSSGEGLGFSSGGGLSSFTTDMTEKAERGELDPTVGREEEIERLIHIIMRRTKNNPLLIGDPGVGKTAIVEGLAQKIINGDVPGKLEGKRVLQLDLTALISETKFRGELEKRLQRVIGEINDLSRVVILFIDEMHMLEQVGGSEGAVGIADVLKPPLARGELQAIGATTWSEYEEYIRPDEPLDRRFQPVLVDEPNPEQALRILRGVRSLYEDFHNVNITDEALQAAVALSDEKIDDRYLPDKAIDLIDEAAAKVSIESARQHKVPLGVVHAASQKDVDTVQKEDIAEIVDHWVIHGEEEKKRDPRHETFEEDEDDD